MGRDAPLSIMIGGLELAGRPCAALLFHRVLRARWYYVRAVSLTRTATTRTFTSVASATVRYRGQRPR